MRLVLGYSGTFLRALSNDRDEVNKYFGQLMTHLQAFYHAPSLKYRITFDAPAPILDMVNSVTVSQCTVAGIEDLSELTVSTLKSAGNGQHLGVFVKDSSGDSTLGIAFMNAICVSDKKKYQVSLNEHQTDVALTAKVFAHEVGHNLGLEHNTGSCNGIMNSYVAQVNTWSTCSVKNLEIHYQSALTSDGAFCLTRDNPANFGASWAPWSKYSLCTKNCGGGTKSRSRPCIGPASCPGGTPASVDKTNCNTQACAPCVDKPGNHCALKAQYGWCGKFSTMKGTCDKSCNVDKIPTDTCISYKGMGFCKQGHVNFAYMMAYCGLTCGVYCS